MTNQEKLDAMWADLFEDGPGESDIAKARTAMWGLPEAVEGDMGHDRILAAYCELWRWTDDDNEAYALAEEWNREKAHPPFEKWEWERKLREAMKLVGKTGKIAQHATKEKSRFSCKWMDVLDFVEQDVDDSFLIEDVLKAGENFVIGGPSKSLKTTITLDMAMSLCRGVPFLGHKEFEVPEAVPVMVGSGESGTTELIKSINRIERDRGMAKAKRGMFHIAEILPHLSVPEHMEVIAEDITKFKAKFFVVDPAYMCTMLAGEEGAMANMFAVGNILGNLTKVGVDTNCTVGLVHHFKKSQGASTRYRQPHKEDLSGAGYDAHVRQWLILNHRERMRDGQFKLWMNVGGSAHHQGMYAVDVDEGYHKEPILGNTWKVNVMTESELEQKEEAEEGREALSPAM